ncbi:MAG: hypothetical protein J6J99_01035 [Oscillibacter sp.]|nr:hypothetical protein [Oscillibacter sp.]
MSSFPFFNEAPGQKGLTGRKLNAGSRAARRTEKASGRVAAVAGNRLPNEHKIHPDKTLLHLRLFYSTNLRYVNDSLVFNKDKCDLRKKGGGPAPAPWGAG